MIAVEFGVIAESAVLEHDELGGERVEAVVAVLDDDLSGRASHLAVVVVGLARERRVGEIARDARYVERVAEDLEVVGELEYVLAVEKPLAERTRVASGHARHIDRVVHVRDYRLRLDARCRWSFVACWPN